jgi:hypothetical protein
MARLTYQRHAGRDDAWAFGIAHRERLVRRYIETRGLDTRPFLKDIVDELIEEIQEARLIEGVLPLDRFAQTERDRGRVVVTVNSRIAEIPGVKDAAGVAYAAKWHESIHVDQHMTPAPDDRDGQQLPLFGDTPDHRLIVCRAVGRGRRLPPIEVFAETAGLAAAIAEADLLRCSHFLRFRALAEQGGDLGGRGWQFLYRCAEAIGVNISALVRYFEQRGLCRVERSGGKARLIADARLIRGCTWPGEG